WRSSTTRRRQRRRSKTDPPPRPIRHPLPQSRPRTMNSPPSSSDAESSSFHLLDPRIQRWIWERDWSQLKDAQERAIPRLISPAGDVVIAAATASGKTEAAFLPILTHLAHSGGLAMYVSPLKALINDQWGRLSELCE